MTTRSAARSLPQPWWLLVLVLPLAGLALLIARPDLDLEWRHQPSHFWLVLVVAAISVALAYFTNEAATRRGDARLVLVSLAFGTSAGFLGLHALATPGVLLSRPNIGFVVATPIGLTIAAALAAASALPLGGPRGTVVVRHARSLRFALIALLLAWGIASLLELPPLRTQTTPVEVGQPIRLAALVAIALYAFAAWHLIRLYLGRRRPLLLAIIVALLLLGEAMIAVAVSRDWHLSWWEWHVLLAVAFGAVALGARLEYRREGSLTGAFGGLYLSGTLERLHRWHADALSDLASARAGRGSIERVLERLRVDGATSEELALLERASSELERADELFRPFLPQQFAARARTDPAEASLGSGAEREVTVLFADISDFTSYSERHSPIDVVERLNAIWTVAVPAITGEDGLIENFTGDGMLAIFNAMGGQPDHAARAVRAAFGVQQAVDALRSDGSEPLRFHFGINTGRAFVGAIGAAGRRSYSAIGDTTNLGSRLLGAAAPGEVVVGETTWSQLGAGASGTALGAIRVKGKREPIRAWRVEGPA